MLALLHQTHAPFVVTALAMVFTAERPSVAVADAHAEIDDALGTGGTKPCGRSPLHLAVPSAKWIQLRNEYPGPPPRSALRARSRGHPLPSTDTTTWAGCTPDRDDR
ncbi:DUF3375 family protein [Saccharomonospora azurea]|uniref:DUF3375 family protein n=1 Tax=Saccharomonospora azurea TaxID=40988 RepID=UPI003D8D9CC7